MHYDELRGGFFFRFPDCRIGPEDWWNLGVGDIVHDPEEKEPEVAIIGEIGQELIENPSPISMDRVSVASAEETEATLTIPEAAEKFMEEYFPRKQELPTITSTFRNGPATIVFWSDGDKTVAKCREDDWYDQEKGLMVAMLTKYIGKGALNKALRKWTDD